MDIVTLSLGVLKVGFELWNTKEGNKYRDRVIKLTKDYNEELDKRSQGIRYSQLKLDRIMRDYSELAEIYIKYAPTK